MASFSLRLPKDLHEQMKKFPKIDWKHIAESAIRQTIEDLLFMNNFIADSEITENDVKELAEKVNTQVAKRSGLV